MNALDNNAVSKVGIAISNEAEQMAYRAIESDNITYIYSRLEFGYEDLFLRSSGSI